MSVHTTKTPPSTTERLQTFLGSNRKLLTIISIVIIGGIVASVGISQWLDAQAERSAEAAEEIQELWESYRDESTDEAEATLRSAITEAVENHPRRYASLRALFVLGELEFSLGNYEASLESYEKLAALHGRSYIEPTALAAAAAAAEETGDIELARELHGRVVEIQDVPNLERPHSLFSLGRLAETQGDVDLALEYYNRLVDEHGSSSWTNLGRNRIIWLTSRGSVSEG
ncbi:MAG: tetratricopeptide repeat protein [Alkalispirochaeta sp.]